MSQLFDHPNRDFQVTFSDLLTRISYTYNAQKATPQGAEIQTNWQVTDNDLINFGVAYLYAHYTNFILPSVDTYGRQNYTGNKMADSPPWEINLGYEHNFDLGNGWALTPRGYVHYQASENLDFRNLPSTRQGGYEGWDISLTYREPDNRWDVALGAGNIENKAVLQLAGPNGAGRRWWSGGARPAAHLRYHARSALVHRFMAYATRVVRESGRPVLHSPRLLKLASAAFLAADVVAGMAQNVFLATGKGRCHALERIFQQLLDTAAGRDRRFGKCRRVQQRLGRWGNPPDREPSGTGELYSRPRRRRNR